MAKGIMMFLIDMLILAAFAYIVVRGWRLYLETKQKFKKTLYGINEKKQRQKISHDKSFDATGGLNYIQPITNAANKSEIEESSFAPIEYTTIEEDMQMQARADDPQIRPIRELEPIEVQVADAEETIEEAEASNVDLETGELLEDEFSESETDENEEDAFEPMEGEELMEAEPELEQDPEDLSSEEQIDEEVELQPEPEVPAQPATLKETFDNYRNSENVEHSELEKLGLKIAKDVAWIADEPVAPIDSECEAEDSDTLEDNESLDEGQENESLQEDDYTPRTVAVMDDIDEEIANESRGFAPAAGSSYSTSNIEMFD